ncbi:MAG TPA: type IV toxin-antitoxin system AbiEi family antitoxin domain-containing protein [Solirubrobacterales bacterium]|nr:type IV toxin-antitoxin system AbiEi family antitoxin domain-containing protein [Solirubrobacterales bacterium]
MDLAINCFAREQHGIVTTKQLVAAGLTRAAISKRVHSGRLYRVHQGVYSVGHDGLSLEAGWMAAVLACGSGAVLSHGSAAVHWKLLRPLDGPIDITVPKRTGRSRRRGIRIHRCRSLDGGANLSTTSSQTRPLRLVTIHERIPITTVARTLADLRRSDLRPSLVRRAIRQAEFLQMPLGDIQTDRTRSDLERDFLRLCRRYRLPPPEVNVPIGRLTVDFLWRPAGLIVETDSYVTHGGTVAFEDDRQRDLELRRRGYRVHRFSGRQLELEPKAIAEDVAAALRLIIAA